MAFLNTALGSAQSCAHSVYMRLSVIHLAVCIFKPGPPGGLVCKLGSLGCERPALAVPKVEVEHTIALFQHLRRSASSR